MIEIHGWLNRNSQRTFPIREDSVTLSENTNWRIPSGLIADLFVVAPGAQNLCITAITVTSRIVSVVIGDPATGESVATASAVVGEGQPYVQKQLTPILPGAAGTITFGLMLAEGEKGWGAKDFGQHIFGPQTLIESRCVLNPGPFPVNSLSPRRGTSTMSGLVEMSGNDQVAIGLAEGDDDGDPVSLISIDLTNPEGFVSPCETRESPCQCRSMPIMSINGVLPDENGRITVELIDEFGHIIPFGPNALNFLLTRTAEEICVKPAMPDDRGRLPDALGNYEWDEDPLTDYTPPAPGAGPTADDINITGDNDELTGDME